MTRLMREYFDLWLFNWTLNKLDHSSTKSNARNVNKYSLAQFQLISEAQRTFLVRNKSKYIIYIQTFICIFNISLEKWRRICSWKFPAVTTGPWGKVSLEDVEVDVVEGGEEGAGRGGKRRQQSQRQLLAPRQQQEERICARQPLAARTRPSGT